MECVNNLEPLKFCCHKKTTWHFIKKNHAIGNVIFSFRNAVFRFRNSPFVFSTYPYDFEIGFTACFFATRLLFCGEQKFYLKPGYL